MRTDCINNTNFQGKLVVVNKLSNKPSRCLNKVKDSMEELVRNKDYNLYVQQDYSNDKIRIIAEYPFPLKPSQRDKYIRTQKYIPTVSNASKYLYTAQDVLNEHEENLRTMEQKKWENNQKQQFWEMLKGDIETILLFPLFVINDILHSINPKWSKKFEKSIIDKI